MLPTRVKESDICRTFRTATQNPGFRKELLMIITDENTHKMNSEQFCAHIAIKFVKMQMSTSNLRQIYQDSNLTLKVYAITTVATCLPLGLYNILRTNLKCENSFRNSLQLFFNISLIGISAILCYIIYGHTKQAKSIIADKKVINIFKQTIFDISKTITDEINEYINLTVEEYKELIPFAQKTPKKFYNQYKDVFKNTSTEISRNDLEISAKIVVQHNALKKHNKSSKEKTKNNIAKIIDQLYKNFSALTKDEQKNLINIILKSCSKDEHKQELKLLKENNPVCFIIATVVILRDQYSKEAEELWQQLITEWGYETDILNYLIQQEFETSSDEIQSTIIRFIKKIQDNNQSYKIDDIQSQSINGNDEIPTLLFPSNKMIRIPRKKVSSNKLKEELLKKNKNTQQSSTNPTKASIKEKEFDLGINTEKYIHIKVSVNKSTPYHPFIIYYMLRS